MIVDYYETETSPRKLEPEFIPPRMPQRRPTPKRKNQDDVKKIQKINNSKARKLEKKKNIKIIIEICLIFGVLLTLSYRYSLINNTFNEKEALKKNLSEIQKQNAQLKVNIEQGMNIGLIEQEAKEQLGMKKLDNGQKVYVNLDKEDYTESSVNKVQDEKPENWWSKFLKDLFNIK